MAMILPAAAARERLPPPPEACACCLRAGRGCTRACTLRAATATMANGAPLATAHDDDERHRPHPCRRKHPLSEPEVDAAEEKRSGTHFPHCRDKSIMRPSFNMSKDWRSKRSGRNRNYSAWTCIPSHFSYRIGRSNFRSRFEITMLLIKGRRITPRDPQRCMSMLGIFRGIGDSNIS